MPKTEPSVEVKQQFWIHEGGEYEYPVYEILDEPKGGTDKLVYLTYDQATLAQKLHADWLRLQEWLCEAWFGDAS